MEQQNIWNAEKKEKEPRKWFKSLTTFLVSMSIFIQCSCRLGSKALISWLLLLTFFSFDSWIPTFSSFKSWMLDSFSSFNWRLVLFSFKSWMLAFSSFKSWVFDCFSSFASSWPEPWNVYEGLRPLCKEFRNVVTRQMAGATSSKMHPLPGPWMIHPKKYHPNISCKTSFTRWIVVLSSRARLNQRSFCCSFASLDNPSSFPAAVLALPENPASFLAAVFFLQDDPSSFPATLLWSLLASFPAFFSSWVNETHLMSAKLLSVITSKVYVTIIVDLRWMRNSILVDEDKFCNAWWRRFVALSNCCSKWKVVASNCCKLKQLAAVADDWAAWLSQQVAGAAKVGQEGTRPSWQAVQGGKAAWLSQQVAGAVQAEQEGARPSRRAVAVEGGQATGLNGAGKGARQMPRKRLQAEQEGRHCCLFGTFLMTGPFCGQKLLNIGFGTRWMGTRSKYQCLIEWRNPTILKHECLDALTRSCLLLEILPPCTLDKHVINCFINITGRLDGRHGC